MPPPTKTSKVTVPWWLKQDAYGLNDDICVQYELQFGKDLIKPGDKIKIKNMRSIYRFRCLANNVVLGTEWIDCMDINDGAFYSFRIEKIKGVVKAKRSRAKKANA